MLSPIIFVVIVIGLIVVQVVLWAMFLRFGLRWAEVPDVTMRRIVVATASVFAIQSVLNVSSNVFTPTSGAQLILTGVLGLATTILIPCLVIMRLFKARFLRALQAFLPTLLASGATIAIIFLVLRPFVYEAFASSPYSMAPTLLGNHWRSTCPQCGQSTFCAPVNSRYALREPPRIICGNFHIHQVPDAPQHVFGPDNILVAKFLSPR